MNQLAMNWDAVKVNERYRLGSFPKIKRGTLDKGIHRYQLVVGGGTRIFPYFA
jgi:hypothetical protein